jgi:uncharacterized phage protein (TIGR01671 family)
LGIGIGGIMRPIEFRQWLGEERKRMFYGIGAIKEGMWAGMPEVTWSKYPLMQYIGLLDKNGKKIFESDIISYADICSDKWMLEEQRTIGIVKWFENARFEAQEIRENHKGGHYRAFWDWMEDIEIIGNIWENPELLNPNP